jgi:hypothetical protein
MRETNLHCLWRSESVAGRFRTGVSLHSHTLHSEENMAFVPRYTANVPVVGVAIARQGERYKERAGVELDYSRAFWRPPLGPREAFLLEARQIQELGLDAFVSLSDHDNIQAGLQLAFVQSGQPASVEWTIPYGPSFFHLGLHNLPAERATEVLTELHSFTAQPELPRLAGILSWINEFEDTLIVLNHPMWDEARIGHAAHVQLLDSLLRENGEFLHALELNGLRPWQENLRVTRLARDSGYVLVSGGDRHGVEPNANINLSNSGSFAEFVSEIRRERMSDVLFLPQYREPIRLRMMDAMWDIIREHPDLPEGRRRWNERVFFKGLDGVTRPLSEIWKGNEPWPVKWFLGGLRALKSRRVRIALRAALADPQEAGS